MKCNICNGNLIEIKGNVRCLHCNYRNSLAGYKKELEAKSSPIAPRTVASPFYNNGTNQGGRMNPSYVQGSGRELSKHALYETMLKATCLIRKGYSKGTGWAIAYKNLKNLIVTNYHVVDGASVVQVQFCNEIDRDENYYPAEVVFGDPVNDIAFVKLLHDIPSINLLPGRQCLQLAEYDSVRVGDDVATLGNPKEMKYVFTSGTISGKGRGYSIGTEEGFSKILVNLTATSGNSGGCVLRSDGTVIGMVTAMSAAKVRGSNVDLGYHNQIQCVSCYAIEMSLELFISDDQN